MRHGSGRDADTLRKNPRESGRTCSGCAPSSLAQLRPSTIGHVNARQARAAQLLGRGLSCRATAAELQISPRTLTRWRSTVPGFKVAEQGAHEERLGEVTDLRATLEAALVATRRDGTPEWNTRMRAAQLLLAVPEHSADFRIPAAVTVRITRDGDPVVDPIPDDDTHVPSSRPR